MKEVLDYDNHFLSYSGVGLPLKLVSPITLSEVENRNTYFGALIDEQDRFTLIHKVVYGEIDLEHKYTYDDVGNLCKAEVTTVDGESTHFVLNDRGVLSPVA